jgi:hypothetical protein
MSMSINVREKKIHAPPGDLGNFLEKVGALHFFDGSRPLDVVGEQMCEDRLRDRNGESTEKEEAGAK